MPRARAHAAARIDGAECTRALQVRRQWRRRIAPRDATGAECGASACGLTPRRRPRRRRRRRRKLLVLDDHRRHATVSSAFFAFPAGGGAPSGASVHRSDAPGVWPGCVSSVRATRGARSAERGARSVVRGGGARATRGARSDGSYAEYSTSVSVRRRALSLLLEPECVLEPEALSMTVRSR
jgi:hypothetical protein